MKRSIHKNGVKQASHNKRIFITSGHAVEIFGVRCLVDSSNGMSMATAGARKIANISLSHLGKSREAFYRLFDSGQVAMKALPA